MSASRRPSSVAFAISLLFLCQAAAGTLPPGFQESAVITGRINPTAVRFAPNGQVFLAEKSGLVLVYDGIGDNTPTTVADLRTNTYNFWDRGLLGLAVDPQFPVRPYLYALYAHDTLPGGTAPQWGQPGVSSDPCPNPPGATGDGCVVMGRLVRIDVNPITMQGSEVVLIEGNWCQQYPSHSMGDLAFGSDGMLYLSAGEGASFTFADFGQDGNPVNPCGDPGGPNPTPPTAEGGALRSQDVLTAGDTQGYGGSILRVDVSDPVVGVQVPVDNPLVANGVPGDDYVIAHGLRNPFRFSSRPGTPEIWITDVGWTEWEEVDVISDPTDSVVENFGWPCFEGANGTSQHQAGYDSADLAICEGLYANPVVDLGGGATSVVTPSLFAYRHNQQVIPGELCGTGSSSATGAAFYQGGDYGPFFTDAFFFADSSRRCIWTMPIGPSGSPDPALRAPFLSNADGRVVDVQIGPGGDVFYVDFDGGNVFRVQHFENNEPPTAVLVATPTSGSAPLFVSLDATGSSDPEDGSNLIFAWDFDNDGDFDDSSDAQTNLTITLPGSHLVRLRVTDSQDVSDIETVDIAADNSPPLVEILAPTPSLLWKVGDPIAFAGQAVDPQDGLLPPENLVWTVIIHHCTTLVDCHTHPVQDLPGVAAGEIIAPDHDYPSHLELKLTATDLGVGGWWDGEWTRRQKLTFDNALQGTNLDGFPVMVRLDPTRIDYGQVADDGSDLRFLDADGTTELPYEIDTWNEAGVSTVWVRVPRIDASSSEDHVWMYYGNNETVSGEDPAGTWAGYAGVWHLDGSLDDSTGNANHGTNGGSTLDTGVIGGARRFNGASGIEIPDAASLQLTGAVTLEAWIAVDNPVLAGSKRILSKKPVFNALHGYNLEYAGSTGNLTSQGSGTDFSRARGVDLDANWHWVGASINGGIGRMFVDGIDRTNDQTITPLVAGNSSLRFGREAADFFLGRIDEIRIAPVARPAAWMAAQNLSMTDAFVSFGEAEQSALLSATASVEIFPATVNLSFFSYPSGFQLAVGPDLATAPFGRTVIVGSSQSLSAPSPQQGPGGVVREFQLWSDLGAQSHNIVAPAGPTTYTAFYVMPECADGLDNDSDGSVDFPEDPGCAAPLAVIEGTACDNNLDDDGDGSIDWDGGPNGEPADAQCAGNARRNKEVSGCGIGFELAFVLPLILSARKRLRRR